MLISFLKNCIRRTNECIILSTPLIIFYLIADAYFNFAKFAVNSSLKLLLAIFTMIILLSAFMAGWFYMAKKTLELADRVFVFDKDRIKAIWQLVLSLPKGFGRLFLSFLGITTITGIIFTAVIVFVTFIVSKFVGTIDSEILTNGSLLGTAQEIYYTLTALPTNEMLVINSWYFLTFILITFLSFFGILWIPEVVYTQKGAIQSLISSVKKIVITYKKTLFIYIYIYILYSLLILIIALFVIHPILYFFAILLFYYFVIHVTVVVFSYYEQDFLKQ